MHPQEKYVTLQKSENKSPVNLWSPLEGLQGFSELHTRGNVLEAAAAESGLKEGDLLTEINF